MRSPFKLRFSLSNFQLCRSSAKHPTTTSFFSPVNPKYVEISFPTGPEPPPSTPIPSTPLSPKPEENKKNIAAFNMLKTLKSFSSFNSNFSFNSEFGNEEEESESVISSRYDSSTTVVKVSEEPYEDFKKSMLEMILQKHMFEVDDLEQLLQCFLSLNSPEYHATIVEAFTEIWEVLFCQD